MSRIINAKIEANSLDDLKEACESLIKSIENGNRTGIEHFGQYWMIEYNQDLEARLKKDKGND